MKTNLEESAKNSSLEMIYFNVKSTEKLSLFLNDSTYICYDTEDNTLKRISSKVRVAGEDNKIICDHVIYQITLDQMFK